MKKKEEKTKRLLCPNEKCQYIWKYKGKAPFITSCPRCKWNVNIIKNQK